MIIRTMQPLCVVLAISVVIVLQSAPAPATTTPADNNDQKTENEKELLLPEVLDGQPEPEDRLVILPEIKREENDSF